MNPIPLKPTITRRFSYFLAFIISFIPLALGQAAPLENPLAASGINSLSDLVAKILHIAVLIGTPVVVFMIIFAGFKLVTARGDVKKLEEGKSALTWSVIGAAVLLGAEAIAFALQSTVNQILKGN